MFLYKVFSFLLSLITSDPQLSLDPFIPQFLNPSFRLEHSLPSPSLCWLLEPKPGSLVLQQSS